MRSFEGHRDFAMSVAFSPDGQQLLTAGADHVVRLWDVRIWEERVLLPRQQSWTASAVFSPDGTLVAVAGHDRTVRLLDARTGAERRVLKSTREVSDIAFGDGVLAWVDYAGHVRCCPVEDPDERMDLQKKGKEQFCLAFAPNGTTLAAGGIDCTITVWDSQTSGLLKKIDHGDRRGCRSLAWSRDGRLLFAALGGGVGVWRMPQGQHTQLVEVHEDVVSSVAVSPDGRLLLSGSWDKTVWLYDLDAEADEPLRPRFRYEWDVRKVFDVAFSPDGMLAAAASMYPRSLIVWDLDG
jgi:WD40 repeat protein